MSSIYMYSGMCYCKILSLCALQLFTITNFGYHAGDYINGYSVIVVTYITLYVCMRPNHILTSILIFKFNLSSLCYRL